MAVVKILLDHGADIHAKNDQAFRSAMRRGQRDTAQLLKNRGATENMRFTKKLDYWLQGM